MCASKEEAPKEVEEPIGMYFLFSESTLCVCVCGVYVLKSKRRARARVVLPTAESRNILSRGTQGSER